MAYNLFLQADTDHDRRINFKEYINIVYDNFCQPEKLPPPKKPIKIRSKLRLNIWSSLQRIYELYVQGELVETKSTEIRKLVIELTGELSVEDEGYISRKMFSLNIKFV